jgi:thiosulfate dehydrogenase [quinone] large subunit
MFKFMRENKYAAMVMTFVRLYLGYSWFTGGLGKVTSGAFDASGFLNGAIAKPVAGPDGIVFGWYVSFLEHFALPNADLFNTVIPWGETLVGLGLLLGCLTTYAAFFGLVMNFSFLMAGTVSHNPTDILLGFLILVAGANAGKFGLDRWVMPIINTKLNKKPIHLNTVKKAS